MISRALLHMRYLVALLLVLGLFGCSGGGGGSDESDDRDDTSDTGVVAPLIGTHPADLTVTEGESAEFFVEATGTSLNYQWQMDERDIPGATGSSYTIKGATLADNGAGYRCVVSNEAGSVTSNSATLTVNMAVPVITAQPSHLMVIEGDPATFSITATGSNLTCQWQKDESDIPGATSSSYTIVSTSIPDCGTYRCVVSNPAGDVSSTGATLMVLPHNNIAVTNATAVWDKGVARLTWDGSDGVRYQVYRGESANEISLLAETGDHSFIDDTAQYYYTYYYRFATVKDYTNPLTGEVIHCTGPLSAIVVLQALPPPRAKVSGAGLSPDGTYTMLTGSRGPYTFRGTYEAMTGNVVVTATLGDLVVTGSGSGGSFNIQLPCAGKWQIIVAEETGWKNTSTNLNLTVDDRPPGLTVDKPGEQATADDFILITGVASDAGSGLDAVVVTSDRYPGQSFGAVVDSMGVFSGEVPLRSGKNLLTVIAQDMAGNKARQSVTITMLIPALPAITINAPVNGATVFKELVTLSGIVRSSLDPEQIKLLFDGQTQFPTGADGEYAFSFDNIRLVKGPNTLTVSAETIYGNVSAQTTVNYRVDQPDDKEALPAIEIYSPLPGVFLTENLFEVKGIARSGLGIQGVTVNGQPAQMVGPAAHVSFTSELQFPGADEAELQIVVEATDARENRASVSFIVRFDARAPVIRLTSSGLQPAPSVNAVTKTPYHVTGTVTEKNLAGVSINDQGIELLPMEPDETYSFDAGIVLVRGEERMITVEAWDMAGNRTSCELILRLDAMLAIEVISPADGAELIASDETLEVEVTVRVPGMAEDDRVIVRIDNTAAIDLHRSGNVANGAVSIPATDGEHKMITEVKNAGGALLAGRTTHFSIINTANTPLAVDHQEPANNARGVDPNAFIAFYFNKPIDPQQLDIEVLETVHGEIYAQPEKGTDIRQFSDVKLVEVHRDREPVPGGLSHFPENTMAAFYPGRDFAYGGTLYVTLLYNGEELSRSSFNIRPLPTFIQGFVADQFMGPLAGIEVEIPDLERKAITNYDGNYGFGFGEPASQHIPGGRYRAVINPGMKNPAFGSVERWINVDEGRLNSVGITPIPVLSQDEPFRRIRSGQSGAVLAGGDLILDLSEAMLTFPDGRDQGDVHLQYMELPQIGYPIFSPAIPYGAFVVQPIGIEVSGNVRMTFSMPAINESHDYVSVIGERVLLVGLDPGALEIVPVGVGLVDVEHKKVISKGEVALKRLDYLGYAFVAPEAQETLERFASGEIGLAEMIGELK